ncbi:MAG: hypothetical protein Kow0056_09350 [Coriobacteriia bacterium]
MATRSPHNPRYQKDAKVGKTRKSAASAKPKRRAGERAAKEEPKKKRSLEVISTPEIKELRRRWWFFMFVALAAALVLLVPAVQNSQILRSITFGVWTASFATAVYIEWFKIRKLRKEEIERRKKGKKSG